MFKTYSSLKDYADSEGIGYCHFITQKNKGEAGNNLLEIQKGWKYIDKTSLLIYLLAENQKKIQ